MSEPPVIPPALAAEDRLWAALLYLSAPLGPLLALARPARLARAFVRAHHPQALGLGAFITLLALVLYVPTAGFSCLLFGLDAYYAYRAYRGQTFAIPLLTPLLVRWGLA